MKRRILLALLCIEMLLVYKTVLYSWRFFYDTLIVYPRETRAELAYWECRVYRECAERKEAGRDK